jgi:NTE family protein
MKWTGKKVGLALGGGGVRGLAHIGVLNVLEEEEIAVDLIVGTSAGALIGGAYASGMTTKEITAKVTAYLKSPELPIGHHVHRHNVSPGPKRCCRKCRFSPKTSTNLFRALISPSILPAEDFQSLFNSLLPTSTSPHAHSFAA